MATPTQILQFVYENDTSKNRRVFRMLKDACDLEDHLNGEYKPKDLNTELHIQPMLPFYASCLRRNFHEFKMTINGFKCICACNAPPGRLAGAVIFFHGLGASPHSFMRLFDNFYAYYGASVPIAFILPQAQEAMHPNELGADTTCYFGSYKWWDIMDPSWSSTQLYGRRIREESSATQRKDDQEEPVSGDTTKASTPVSSSLNNMKNKDKKRAKGKLDKSTPIDSGRSTDKRKADKNTDRFFLGQGRFQSIILGRKCASDVPSGLLTLRPQIEKLRKDVCRIFKVEYRHVAISGFSMGAMLAADAFFNSSEPPLALGVFSGAPLSLKHWRDQVTDWKATGRLPDFQGCPILQSHGHNDSLLPLRAGRMLRKAFREHDMHHRMAIFAGDHFLPDTIINLFGSVVIARLRDVHRAWNTLISPLPTSNRSIKSTSKDSHEPSKPPTPHGSKRTGPKAREDMTSEETEIEKLLGSATEILGLLEIEDDVEFSGYFEKLPFRHFFGGSAHASKQRPLSDEELETLRARRSKRRERLAIEFGFPDSDEKLCESSGRHLCFSDFSDDFVPNF